MAHIILNSKFKAPGANYAEFLSYTHREEAFAKHEAEAPVKDQGFEGFMDYTFRLGANRHKSLNREGEAKSILKTETMLPSFSINQKALSQGDIKEVKQIYRKAEENGSVLWQDVVSFENKWLEAEGIYNRTTGQLDMERLYQASKKMMDRFFADENIHAGFWTAQIHFNTDNLHIHFSSVEHSNTRKVQVGKNGTLEPRGKRKQTTIDRMKADFAKPLVDRTAQLSRISDLRNYLYQDVKGRYADRKADLQLVRELYGELPADRREWVYKRLPPKTQRKLDKLTDKLMRGKPEFAAYMASVKEESSFRQKLYGESKQGRRDYERNQKADLYKRLGNSVLKELKKEKFDAKDPSLAVHRPGTQRKKQAPIIRRGTLNRIERALSDDFDKWKAERDYERTQERIAWEQQRGGAG